MTYQKQDIDGNQYVSTIDDQVNRELAKIETASIENDNKHTALDGRDDELDAKLNQIINETALNPNKDPEVTNARSSAIYGDFETVDNRLENSEAKIKKIESPTLLKHTQTFETVKSLPDGALDGAVSDLSLDGLSLVNSVKNGNFSDGTTGWGAESSATLSATNNILTIVGTGVNNATIALQRDVVRIGVGDKIFYYSKARVTNTDTKSLFSYLLDGNDTNLHPIPHVFNPIKDKWYELYAKVTVVIGGLLDIRMYHAYDNATTANGKTMEVDGNAGVFAINMTALGIENYTETQMLELVRGGYFKGLQSIKNPSLKTMGKNLFDKDTVITGKYVAYINGRMGTNAEYCASDFIGIQPSKTYTLSGENQQIAFYDGDKNYISGRPNPVTTFNTPANAKYVRLTVAINNLDVAQLEFGEVETEGEPYKSAQITTETELRRLPNGVKDKLYLEGGNLMLGKRVGEHLLKSTDITSLYTGPSNVDLVQIPTNLIDNIKKIGARTQGMLLASNFKSDISKSDSYSEYNNSSEIGTITSLLSLININIIVSKNKYANLAAAQADLVGTRIYYQLATPELINLTATGQAEGLLESFKNGTVVLNSDTFIPPSVSFNVPSDLGAQVSSLLHATNIQAKQLKAKANKAQEGWIEPTLLNGWVNYGDGFSRVAYYKDDLGIVRLKGMIKGTTINTVAFILPLGYRPKDSISSFIVLSNDGLGRVIINNQGMVFVGSSNLGSVAQYELFNVSFRAED